MTPELTKPQIALEQLADLTQTLEKEKVQLTPEVEEYTRNHVRAVQNKLQAGEDVYESDLEFIPKVKMWVMMPKEWREKYRSVEEMEKSYEYSEFPEAKKRHISPKQWLDLLHVMKAADKERGWIDETFKFPGGGKVETIEDLYLGNCTSLTKLPEGLSVEEDLYLDECTSLTALPENLYVGGSLDLIGCTSLTALSKGLSIGGYLNLSGCTALTTLPEGLSVGKYLNLSGCTALTSLPEGLSVGGFLDLRDCTFLTTLPERLSVGGHLDLGKCTSLKALPEDLSVGKSLILNGCTSLKALPEGLSVAGGLNLDGCTSLKALPEGLSVAGGLYLSKDINEQVKEDAKRLERDGKISGGIFIDNKNLEEKPTSSGVLEKIRNLFKST